MNTSGATQSMGQFQGVVFDLAAALPRRIEFVEPAADAGGGVQLVRLAVLGAGLFMLIVAAILWLRVVRSWIGSDPSERAFSAISRKLKIGGPDRARIRELAESIDAQPAALLLSEHAFFKAVDRAAVRNFEPRELLDLESAVFRRPRSDA